MTEELLAALGEIKRQSPDIRLGQLVVNLSYLARGPSHEAPWDVEDAELLAAARVYLARRVDVPAVAG